MKSGRHFKVGRSNSVGRREWELGIKIPVPPDASPAALARRPLGAGQLRSLGHDRTSSFACRSAPWYPARMKVAEVQRMLQDDGWYLVATRGSYRQFKHSSKPGRVTVPGKPSDDLAIGTLSSILKQAGLKK